MNLLLTLALTPLAAFALRRPLQRWPWLFYAAATLAVGIGLYALFASHPSALLRSYASFIQRGQVAVALFALVMYIGVFGENSRMRGALMPIRAELSLLASIFICGHFIPYLLHYLQMAANLMTLKPGVLASLLIAVILLVLLAFLALTSLSGVKRLLSPEWWRRIQLLAYPFFALIYLHLLGSFLPSALKGTPQALLALATYTALFAGYLILRICRYRHHPIRTR
ncbi:MAG: ferric reductase-like transmembrane domain-containing protein [Coriobacteriales bacterium]|nr:ferric reductase-like transmembrane domain-containing protein [Coriobacteriales bacterium]